MREVTGDRYQCTDRVLEETEEVWLVSAEGGLKVIHSVSLSQQQGILYSLIELLVRTPQPRHCSTATATCTANTATATRLQHSHSNMYSKQL